MKRPLPTAKTHLHAARLSAQSIAVLDAIIALRVAILDASPSTDDYPTIAIYQAAIRARTADLKTILDLQNEHNRVIEYIAATSPEL